MQILQSGPSQATLRQQAMDQGMGNILDGFKNYSQEQKTKRQEALQLQEMANQYRQQGYDVTPDMVKQSLEEKPSGFAKFFGAKDPKPVDMFGKRTDEWNKAQEEKAFKRKLDEADLKFKQENQLLDRQYKQAQMSAMGLDNKRKQAEIEDIASGGKFKREMVQDQVKDIGKKNSSLLVVKNAMDEALTQLKDPNMDEDSKIKVGQGLLKLLNSAEGSDAVGAEEAKRIGSYLEYQMGNFTGPGNFWGRDMDGFVEQVSNNSKFLGGRIARNEEGAKGLMSGASMSELANAVPGGSRQQSIALNPVNFNGQNPQVKFSPTNINGPIPEAHASELKKVDTNSLASRREQLLRKAGAK